MEDEDYRLFELNDTTMKVFRDGRIMTYDDSSRKRWVDRKFQKGTHGGYLYFGTGSSLKGNYKQYLVHNVITMCYLGEKPDGYETDHINNNHLDNRLDNLQYIPKIDNDRKRIYHKKGQLIKGWSLNKYGRFRARIRHYGEYIDLGTYDTEEEARQAYIDGKLKYHNVVIEN